jgi:hypothetical protein
MVMTTMRHQTLVGITTHPPQSLQFFGTSGGGHWSVEIVKQSGGVNKVKLARIDLPG